MFLFLKVCGHSMEPYAREGDFVFTLPFCQPKVGDVTVIQHKAMFLLKRLKKQNASAYWFEGDNKAESTDSRMFGWIDQKDVVGKAFVARKTKYLRFAIMSKIAQSKGRNFDKRSLSMSNS